MRRFAVSLIAASAVVLGIGMAVDAQEYPPVFNVTASPTTVAPSGSVTATVTGCTVGNRVVFDLEGSTASSTCAPAPVGGAIAIAFIASTAANSASGTVTAPAAEGVYPLTGTETETGKTGTVDITVTSGPAPTTTAPGGDLASTGSDGSSTTLLIAGGLFAMGIALFAVSRLRHRNPATS